MNITKFLRLKWYQWSIELACFSYSNTLSNMMSKKISSQSSFYMTSFLSKESEKEIDTGFAIKLNIIITWAYLTLCWSIYFWRRFPFCCAEVMIFNVYNISFSIEYRQCLTSTDRPTVIQQITFNIRLSVSIIDGIKQITTYQRLLVLFLVVKDRRLDTKIFTSCINYSKWQHR